MAPDPNGCRSGVLGGERGLITLNAAIHLAPHRLLVPSSRHSTPASAFEPSVRLVRLQPLI